MAVDKLSEAKRRLYEAYRDKVDSDLRERSSWPRGLAGLLSDQAWADIRAAAGKSKPVDDIEARGELELILFWEYPALAYDHKREAERLKRVERMHRHIEPFAAEHRALFPPYPKGELERSLIDFVVEDSDSRVGVLATFKTREEADQWRRARGRPWHRVRSTPAVSNCRRR